MFECDKVGTAVPAVLSDSGALDKPRNYTEYTEGAPRGDIPVAKRLVLGRLGTAVPTSLRLAKRCEKGLH